MFILDEKYAVPQTAMDRAIDGLLDGLFYEKSAIDRRRERIMKASYYENYARLCLNSAYPNGVPSELTDERLTVELIQRAADGVYSFRMDSAMLPSEIALECRWMLEGLLGFHVTAGLEWYQWRHITSATPAEQAANLEILDAKLRQSRDEFLRILSNLGGSSASSLESSPIRRRLFGRRS